MTDAASAALHDPIALGTCDPSGSQVHEQGKQLPRAGSPGRDPSIHALTVERGIEVSADGPVEEVVADTLPGVLVAAADALDIRVVPVDDGDQAEIGDWLDLDPAFGPLDGLAGDAVPRAEGWGQQVSALDATQASARTSNRPTPICPDRASAGPSRSAQPGASSTAGGGSTIPTASSCGPRSSRARPGSSTSVPLSPHPEG